MAVVPAEAFCILCNVKIGTQTPNVENWRCMYLVSVAGTKSKSRCEHKTSCFIYDQFSRRCIKLDPIRISRCALCRTVYNQQQNDVQWAISPPCLLVHGVAPSSSGPIKAIISGVQHMCAAPLSGVFYCCWEAPRRMWAVGNARKADTCELRGSQTSSSMCSSWRLQDKHLLSVKHLTP